MENDLHQAFYGVFCSSKEIIKSSQRHLYVNMLDLLGRTCKATGLAESKIGADNLVKFWLEDILPLVFDDDIMIQSCAVSSMEQGISLMDISMIHNSKHWPELRNVMVSTLPDKIHTLRSNKNKYWHQIWCLVIRILDREILNGASIINSFLSTVELGFRSSDCNVRAETFVCWRLLIKIFHCYNELLTPKRLKLICIPLKSTQSKSASLANVKIRVWWYFITCIGEKLSEHFNKVVEPFLLYVFGSPTRDVNGDVQQYENIQIPALLCLAQLLIEDPDEFIDILIHENNLEKLNRPSPLLKLDFLKENWKPIAHAVVSALKIFAETNEDSENRDTMQHLCNWLILRIVRTMLYLNYAPFTEYICQGIRGFLPTHTQPLNNALNCIASNGITFDTSACDVENFSEVLRSLIALLIAGKPFVTNGVLQRCIEQVGKISQFFEKEQVQQQALRAIIKVVCDSKDDDDLDAYETRVLCWKRVAQGIINHLSDKNLSYRRKEFADIVNNFIIWPLRQFTSFTGRIQTACFNEDFCALWRQLLLCGQNAPDREIFLTDVQKTLRDLIKNGQSELPFSELVNAYITAMLKLDSANNSRYIIDILLFLRDLMEQPNITATKSFEVYLNTLRNVFGHIKNQEIIDNFELVKASIAQVVNIVAKEKPSNPKAFNEWKRGITERFRTISQKNYSTEIKEIFKHDDVFVIIPTVWMLDPEKLTERQKERFAERADIPALYNDMSQSQDSSIKPWTPRKVVIAKKDQTEIIIGSNQQEDVEMEMEMDKSPKSTITDSNTPYETRSKGPRRRATKTNDTTSDDNSLKTKNSKTPTIVIESESEEVRSINKSPNETVPTEATTAIRTRKSLRSGKLEDGEQKATEKVSKSSEPKSPLKSKQSETNNNQKKTSESIECISEKATPLPLSAVALRKSLASQETQMQENTETQIVTETETQDPIEKIIPSEETIPETPIEPIAVTNTEPILPESDASVRFDALKMNLEPKELSPKKPSTKIMGLSSPPDRKSTNNSCSPSLRPKPSAHLTRGAQLINMIRSKMKGDGPTTSSSANLISSSRSLIVPKSIMNGSADKRESTPVPDGLIENFGSDNTSTPLQERKKELLTFSKRLPSPSASPSASILKRKLRRDSLDDIAVDSPASKRKRVSFHDPPVSLTKEYLKDAEENQGKTKRCLSMEKVNTTPGSASENKHSLKRRSKLDSMVEIETFSNEPPPEKQQSINNNTSTASTSSARKVNFEEEPLLEPLTQPSHSSIAKEIHVEILPDVETAMKVVTQECTLDTVLEHYFSAERTATTKEADTLAKFVSKCMTSNSKVKTSVLEVLSEEHSKDFLDHAVQENLSSVVCDRLNIDSVIEYICAKSKLNTSCRNNLLATIPEVLKHSKVETEPPNFIGSLIETINPTDTTILDLIAILMRMRNERQNTLMTETDSTDVSSSNL